MLLYCNAAKRTNHYKGTVENHAGQHLAIFQRCRKV